MEDIRRELRKQPTYVETLLWARLKGSQLAGRKFRRQHSIGVYILDFYCPAERLCLEIDGAVHGRSDAVLHDKERDETLAQLFIKTIRFSNDEVETDINTVLQRIKHSFTT